MACSSAYNVQRGRIAHLVTCLLKSRLLTEQTDYLVRTKTLHLSQWLTGQLVEIRSLRTAAATAAKTTKMDKYRSDDAGTLVPYGGTASIKTWLYIHFTADVDRAESAYE